MNEFLETREYSRYRPLQYWTLLAMLTAASSALQILESPLPRLLPWLKPGLANSLALYALIRLSPGFCVGVVFLRTILTGLVLGGLFSPANLLLLAGGLAGALSMWVGFLLFPRRLRSRKEIT